jgi:hypothetical protein
VFQSVLPLHECTDPAIAASTMAESVAEPLHSVADSAAESVAKLL